MANDSDRDWRSLSAQWTSSDRDAERIGPRVAVKRYADRDVSAERERFVLALMRPVSK
jgi:hypothetical protein